MNEKLGKRKRRRLLAQRRLPFAIDKPPAARYFHGGNAGLKVDDYILPPSVTGVPQNGIVSSQVRRKDRVYVTTDVVAAIGWASAHPRPQLYEVEPEGELTSDPDDKRTGVTAECSKAKIAVVHTIPEDTIEKARAALRNLGSDRDST
jgi:hypothetical protein